MDEHKQSGAKLPTQKQAALPPSDRRPRPRVAAMMQLVARIALVLLVAPAGQVAAAEADFTGSWNTKTDKGWTYSMQLSQKGDSVRGNYLSMKGDEGTISGGVRDGVLEFTWTQGEFEGTGEFTMAGDGSSFAGTYQAEDNPKLTAATMQGVWTGTRGNGTGPVGVNFNGVWVATTDKNWTYSFTISQRGSAVTGTYLAVNPYTEHLDGTGTIQGKVKGRTLRFAWEQGDYHGKGQFTMHDDGRGFDGNYSAEGADDLAPDLRQGTWHGKGVVQ